MISKFKFHFFPQTEKHVHTHKNTVRFTLRVATSECRSNLTTPTPQSATALQGDIESYSVENQITRRRNKKSPGFLSAVRMIWDATKAEMASRSEELLPVISPTPESDAADTADTTDAAVADTVKAKKEKPEQEQEQDAEENSNGKLQEEKEEEGARANEDEGGIDQATFVCLMVKVHYLVICPPVRPGTVHWMIMRFQYTCRVLHCMAFPMSSSMFLRKLHPIVAVPRIRPHG